MDRNGGWVVKDWVGWSKAKREGFMPQPVRQVGRELLDISSGALDSMGHILVLSLDIASHGHHIQGTFEKYPHFRPPSPPSDVLLLFEHVCAGRKVSWIRCLLTYGFPEG
eukprot:1160808-Pelagomonas_calceolata.AAC.26